jgi:hypothetical protein
MEHRVCLDTQRCSQQVISVESVSFELAARPCMHLVTLFDAPPCSRVTQMRWQAKRGGLCKHPVRFDVRDEKARQLVERGEALVPRMGLLHAHLRVPYPAATMLYLPAPRPFVSHSVKTEC